MSKINNKKFVSNARKIRESGKFTSELIREVNGIRYEFEADYWEKDNALEKAIKIRNGDYPQFEDRLARVFKMKDGLWGVYSGRRINKR